ncbi:uncharacterized protein F4822DRAFT_442141 [Hypoxylon trugodes]|uniref:uncharacterized protein n=1 Tax=Hypoxylon trugodes TaxID=326681 RepID=UPI00219BA923|nr:uncharacterized protein F4822DRAFT_442141 [Hypoxylon trugodes]KAI1390900.1 hypothetical protein F4822DRAFT_442141 [Hypoxylon trugodes]
MSSRPSPYHQKRPPSHSTTINPHVALNSSRLPSTLDRPAGRRSGTWTSSSSDHGLLSETEEIDSREEFVKEYNRLARRYGIRLLVPGDFPVDSVKTFKSLPTRRGSWISKALRRTSSCHSTQTIIVRSDQRQLRRRRSIGDAALNLVSHHRRDGFKDQALQVLVRLCGKSLFYLPHEYTPCSLVLPTCFRALAQALVQQADTRGIFRVPGSVRVVDMLYNYYCTDKDAHNISTTTRCPNLPIHIKCCVHDVASAFKRFLAGLPGGILGSLSLFDALVSIHSQLHTDPELAKTKETKLRARLIALAIGTVKSQYQRELICAVFGLLCFIGRIAENTPREDENGRPLPTADLMGYKALSIIFGPLLVNDLITSYNMKVADPAAGLVLLPVSPPKSRKEKRRHERSKASVDESSSFHTVDKINVANSITEMLIIHWREVVRQMRTLGTLRARRHEHNTHYRENRARFITSISDSLQLTNSPERDDPESSCHLKRRDASPIIGSTVATPKISLPKPQDDVEGPIESLTVRRQRSRQSGSCISRRTGDKILAKYLTPTTTGADYELHPKSSSGRLPVKYDVENVLNRLSLGRSSTSSKNKARDGLPRPENQARHIEDPFSANVHEKTSLLHNGSLQGLGISSSEITFHSVKSTIPEPRARGVYSLKGSEDTRGPGFLAQWLSNQPITTYKSPSTAKERNASPANKWKALALVSKASTESLARAAKERRLRRSPGNGSSRRSEDLLAQRDGTQISPRWKSQPTGGIGERKPEVAKFSPEKTDTFETPHESQHFQHFHGWHSPHKPGTLQSARIPADRSSMPTPRRSNSRPLEGAVKAMTALFDNAAKDSPPGWAPVPTGITGYASHDPSSAKASFSRNASPSKFVGSRGSLVAGTPSRIPRRSEGGFQLTETPTYGRHFTPLENHSHFEVTPPWGTHENVSTRFPSVSLRPIDKSFYAPRKAPLTSTAQISLRDRELRQPPSLGSMVPHLEEPPVAQHITFNRPSLSLSPIVHDESDDERAVADSPRPGSSNSTLHAQVRHLQKHLELIEEENIQLRRQLEARENVDIGKLCEQLRETKRECKMWRERAEAAEKRVAVYEQLTARVRGLRDAVDAEKAGEGQVDGSSGHASRRGTSCCTECTEDQEELRDRIRQNVKRRTVMASLKGTDCGGSSFKREGCSGGREKRPREKGKVIPIIIEQHNCGGSSRSF